MVLSLTRLLVFSLCVQHVVSFGGLQPHHILQDFAAHSLDQHPIPIAATALAKPLPDVTEIFRAYQGLLVASPLETKMATGAVLAVLGDGIAQTREPEDYDSKRAVSFCIFDVAYRALCHYAFPAIAGKFHGQIILGLIASIPQTSNLASDVMVTTYSSALEQSLVCQLGIIPLIYYPVFFAITGFVQGLTLEGTVDRAKERFVPLMKRNLLFWIPVQFAVFSFSEEPLQIPLLTLCGLVWTIILSVMAGSAKSSFTEEDDLYCVVGIEDECTIPEQLFPAKTEYDVEQIMKDAPAIEFSNDLVVQGKEPYDLSETDSETRVEDDQTTPVEKVFSNVKNTGGSNRAK